MCGRYSLFASPEDLVEAFNIHGGNTPVDPFVHYAPHHDVRPTTVQPIVRAATDADVRAASAAVDAAVADADGEFAPGAYAAVARATATVAGARTLRTARWWLVPRWASEVKSSFTMFNARSEDARSKPAFRAPWRDGQRCVVPMSGWFEWPGKVKHVIRPTEGTLLAAAGLWERWRNAVDGAEVESFTMLTVAAPDWFAPIHHRSLVLLDRAGVDAWLDPSVATDDLRELLVAPPEANVVAHPVDPKATGLAAIAPVGSLVRVA
jgi:putative SOS response-associated peptidase YedK